MPFYEWPTYINVCAGAISLVLNLAIFLFIWRQREVIGAKFLLWLTSLLEFWSLVFLLNTVSWDESVKEVCDNLQFIPICLFPIIFFLFVNLYSRKKGKIKPIGWILLLIQPILTQVVIWTNQNTHWFRISSEITGMDQTYPGTYISHYGFWFTFNEFYLLAIMVMNIIFLLVIYFKSPVWTRGKLIYLMIGMIIPLITGVATIPETVNLLRGTLILLSLDVSVLLILLSIFRIQVMDLLPIARKTLLDQIPDAVIILDTDGKIVEFNNSAKKSFADLKFSSMGKPIGDLVPNFPTIGPGRNFVTPEDVELDYEKKGQKSAFSARIASLQDEKQELAGWLVSFHDITRRKLEAEKLQEAEVQSRLAFNNAQKHAEELSLLRAVNEELNQATSLRQALIPAMNSVLKTSKGNQIWVALLENDSRFHRTIQYFPDDLLSPLAYQESKANTEDCLRELISGELKGPKYYTSCKCEEGISGLDTLYNDLISFPLKSGAGPLGVLNLTHDKGQPIEDDSLKLIQTICASLSVAVERIRLFRSEYDQRRIAETMRQISVNLTTSLNLNEVLDLLLEQISRLVPYDAGNVMFLDDEKIWISRSKGYEFLGKKNLEAFMQVIFPLEKTPIFQKIVTNKEVYIVNDSHEDPEWVASITAPYFHSWLGAPIIINDKVAAIFSLDKKESGSFTQAHAERVADLCSNASLAIQNATLYEAGIKRIHELESLQATLKDISSELDIKKLLNAIVERAVNLLNANGGALGEYEKELDAIKVTVGINNGVRLIGTSVPLPAQILESLVANGNPIIIEDYSRWTEKEIKYEEIFPHGLMLVPLLLGNELLGALIICDSNPSHKFTEDDSRLISLFAQQAVVAISNARFFTNAKKRAEEAETMRKASAIVASSLEEKQALRLILEQLALVVPCDSASILLPKGDALEIVDGRGFNEEKPIIGLQVPISIDQPGSIVFQEKRPIIIHDMDLEFPNFNNIYHIPIQSWIGVPLLFQKKAIGILAIDSLSKNSYSEEQARIAQAFADQVAIALENVRLYEEAVKSAKRLAGLYRMSQRINANLKPEEVYRAIHKATIELMAPDSFILSLYDEDAKLIHDVYFVDHGIPQKNIDRPLGEGFSGRILKEKKTIMFNNFNLNMLTKTKAVLVGDEKDPTMVRSLIIVPLKLGKKVKGIISAQSYRADAFTEEDKETLELLAAHAVIALDNAQLFSEIQELAITDPLTRIFNRRQFFDLADQEYERTRRYNHPLSLIMFDIDLFKKVNDSHGHSVGDVVLQQIAEICKHALRDVDIFARYGGEEFVILLPETTATEAQLMAERLRQMIARTTLEINKLKVNITLSFGVVEVDDTCRDIEELLDRSDQALYHSKRTGRNCVSIWTPAMRLHDDTQPQTHRHH